MAARMTCTLGEHHFLFSCVTSHQVAPKQAAAVTAENEAEVMFKQCTCTSILEAVIGSAWPHCAPFALYKHHDEGRECRIKHLLTEQWAANGKSSFHHGAKRRARPGLCVENGESRISAQCWVGSFLVSLLQASICTLARWRGDAHKRV